MKSVHVCPKNRPEKIIARLRKDLEKPVRFLENVRFPWSGRKKRGRNS